MDALEGAVSRGRSICARPVCGSLEADGIGVVERRRVGRVIGVVGSHADCCVGWDCRTESDVEGSSKSAFVAAQRDG